MINLAFVFGWWLLCTSCAASNTGRDVRNDEEVVNLERYSINPTYQRASDDTYPSNASSKSTWSLEPPQACDLLDLRTAAHISSGISAVTILAGLLMMWITIECSGTSLIGDCQSAKDCHNSIRVLLAPTFMGLLSLASGHICDRNPSSSMFPVITVLKFLLTAFLITSISDMGMDTPVELMTSQMWGVFGLNIGLGLFQAACLPPP